MAPIRDPNTQEQLIGWTYFVFFAVLIVSGIVVKRVFLHPEFMMFFHLPAAVFLVMAGYKLPAKLRERYLKECRKHELRDSAKIRQ